MTDGAEMGVAPLVSISTAMEPADRRFDFFREVVSGVYCGVESRRTCESVFDASFSAYRLPQVVASIMSAPAHAARRDRGHIRRRPDDSLFLNFSPVTLCRARLGDSTLAIRPGMPLLLDNRQMFELDFATGPRMRLFTLHLPAGALAATRQPVDVERLNASMVRTASGRQMAMQMRLMYDAIDAGDLVLAGLMSRPLLHLLRLMSDETDEPRNPGQDIELSAIKSLARGHLDSADFSLDHLAALLRCSARTIQSRFAEQGETFSAWLLAERLGLARDRLQSPRFAGYSVERVALASGFRDVSHFNRAFKRHHGMPPGAVRGG